MAERIENVPVEPDAHLPVVHIASRKMCHSEYAAERCTCAVEIRGEKIQQVIRGRTKCPRSGECRQVPVGDDSAAGRMSRCRPAFHRWAERDAGVVHSQGPKDPLRYEILIALPRSERESMTKKTDAEIRVFVLGADIPGQLVTG